MNVSRETIAAIATPLGEGGVGIIRISGPAAKQIASRIFSVKKPKINIKSLRVYFGYVVHNGKKLDQAVLTYFKSPKSYTGEDVVEISGHGGTAVLRNILKAALDRGARLAERGEFTKRAFLNGKLDLAQAEAVLDLIKAKTNAGAEAAMGQLEGRLSQKVRGIRQRAIELLSRIEAEIEFDIRTSAKPQLLRCAKDIQKEIRTILTSASQGKILRLGVHAVIVGRPNVGKSCLMNAFLGDSRVIVTDEPGTTRDLIEENIIIKGVLFKLTDTAGIRKARGKAEEIGVLKALSEIKRADLVLVVLDGSEPLKPLDRRILAQTKELKYAVIVNKADKKQALVVSALKGTLKVPVFRISALKGQGIANLENNLVKLSGLNKLSSDQVFVTNERHEECLGRASQDLGLAIAALGSRIPLDLVAIDIKNAIIALGEISGEEVSEEIIKQIFESFCVGK